MTKPNSNWYKCDGTCPDQPRGARYEFPLPVVKGAPVPSKANYSQENVAWMIEFFARILSKTSEEVQFRYENNTPLNKNDDIIVSHPGGEYLPDVEKCKQKSEALKKYEEHAKKSSILKTYMKNSPANISYFNKTC